MLPRCRPSKLDLVQPLRWLLRHRMGANELHPPNSSPFSQKPLRERVCIHSSRCAVFHHSILPRIHRQGNHKPESSRQHKIAIRRTKKRRQWRMEIVHPQPFEPSSMLHLKLFGNSNSPPNTYGVLFDPAFERLPRRRRNHIQHHNGRNRMCYAPSRCNNL